MMSSAPVTLNPDKTSSPLGTKMSGFLSGKHKHAFKLAISIAYQNRTNFRTNPVYRGRQFCLVFCPVLEASPGKPNGAACPSEFPDG
jgi:hypothetical protein